jgi:hypothetical protein
VLRRFDQATARERVFLRATKTINAGEEVLVSFGRTHNSISGGEIYKVHSELHLNLAPSVISILFVHNTGN